MPNKPVEARISEGSVPWGFLQLRDSQNGNMHNKSHREILRWILNAFVRESSRYTLPRDAPRNRTDKHHPAKERPVKVDPHESWESKRVSNLTPNHSLGAFLPVPQTSVPLPGKRSTRLDSTFVSWLTLISPLPRLEDAFIYYGLNIWSWVRTSEGKGGSVSLDLCFPPPHSRYKKLDFLN